MAFPSPPRTWVAGEVVTAAYMNAEVRDALQAVFPAGAGGTNVAHAGGNFTAGGSQTWTVASGDQDTFRYHERGKFMRVNAILVTTSVGGTPHPELRLAIPNSRTVASTTTGLFFGLNNGVNMYGVYQATAGDAFIRLYTDPSLATNWTASTNNTQVRLTAEFEFA